MGLEVLISGLVSVGGMLVPWSLLPPWTLGACDGWVLPGRKFSVD